VLANIAHNDATKQLLDYWLSLPRPEGKLCPYRTDFHTGEIPEAADHIFLDERHSDDVVCVVQAGKALTHILGVNVTGHNLMMLLPEKEFPLEREYFRTLYEQPCAGYMTRISTDIKGRQLVYRTTHLPLLGANGEIRFWVGTGTELKKREHRSQTNLSLLQLIDRELFDIGAGVPDLT